MLWFLFALIGLADIPKDGQVDLFWQAKGDSYYFSIADSGVGLPKEAQAKIFNRFYRIQLENHQLIPGHGLGLSIAQKLTS
jgi:signal transduction histidine kinase